jgi:hypothetical protein
LHFNTSSGQKQEENLRRLVTVVQQDVALAGASATATKLRQVMRKHGLAGSDQVDGLSSADVSWILK